MKRPKCISRAKSPKEVCKLSDSTGNSLTCHRVVCLLSRRRLHFPGISTAAAAVLRLKVKKHLLLSDGFSATDVLRIFSNGRTRRRKGGKEDDGGALLQWLLVGDFDLALSSVSHQSPKRMFWRTHSSVAQARWSTGQTNTGGRVKSSFVQKINVPSSTSPKNTPPHSPPSTHVQWV